MKPQAIPLLKNNFAWLIPVGEDDAIIVDPSEAQGVIAALRHARRRLMAVLTTHHHHDHVGGIAGLVDYADRPLTVIGSALDVAAGRIPYATVGAEPKTLLELGTCQIEVWATPGHTLGAVSYLWRQGGAIFSGDTLFHGGCGRLFEGSAATMHQSLQKFLSLEDMTLLCCGHEYTEQNLAFAASILPEDEHIRVRRAQVHSLRQRGLFSSPSCMAQEKATNVFLRVGEKKLQDHLQAEDAEDAFRLLRELKDGF